MRWAKGLSLYLNFKQNINFKFDTREALLAKELSFSETFVQN